MKTGVFLCTCSGTINIDFKKLKKGIAADVIEVHDQLCQEDGIAKIIDNFKKHELNQAIIACSSKKQVFDALGLNI
ncbi:MAG: hypothetical protein Q8O41_07170, partial [Candidatus Methanoperedens sp.]|nr:hypothetical protein [Candidatus Methanoperedens sp.]